MRNKQRCLNLELGKMMFKCLFILISSCLLFVQVHWTAQSQIIENNRHLTVHTLDTLYSSPMFAAENMIFRNVRTSGSKGNYIVEGELSPAYTSFGYSVDDGHNYIIKEKVTLKNNKKWKSFRINIYIPPEKFPVSGALMLNLYVDPHQSHLLPIPLEYFFSIRSLLNKI